MDENLKTFLTKLAEDKVFFAEFQDLVKDKTPSEELDEQVIRLANDHGIALTKEDIKPLENFEIPEA